MPKEYLNETDKKQLRRYIDDCKNVVIIVHRGPDGDALGSALGLSVFLRKKGNNVTVISPDDVPKVLSSMKNVTSVLSFASNKGKATNAIKTADMIFCVDFNSINRAKGMEDLIVASNATKVQIDHHESPSIAVDLLISDPRSSSTAKMIYKIIVELGDEALIDKTVAEYLYTGMMTDTGNFSFNSQDPEIYEIISRFLKLGINKDEIYANVMNTLDEIHLRLNAHLIADCMTVRHDLHSAFITLNRTDIDKYKYIKSSTEGVVNKPLAIPDIYYSFFLREDPEYIRISARSKGDHDVNHICRLFGGGGHKNAAGGEFVGTFEGAEKVIIDALVKTLNN